jgi:hypothetical protein
MNEVFKLIFKDFFLVQVHFINVKDIGLNAEQKTLKDKILFKK